MEPADYLVHVNALLPCLVVYYALAIQKNVFLAVALYEIVLVTGPILTRRLRRESAGLKAVERLGRSLTKPRKWTTCVQATTGTLCAVGFGGFFIYLTMFQRPLKVLGIEKAIRDGTAERGLVLGSTARDAFLVFVGCWFCTVNPLVISRRPAVLRRLHAIDATRVHQTRSWVVYFSSLRPFGPNRDAPRRLTTAGRSTLKNSASRCSPATRTTAIPSASRRTRC